MPNLETLPPRLEELRAELAAKLPYQPYDDESGLNEVREELMALPLVKLITHYMNWVDRSVARRQRSVNFASGFWKSHIEDDHFAAIRQWAFECEAGADLNPYLSPRVDKRGYTPTHSSGKGIKWADGNIGDKDFSLNTMGVHHFHLVPSDADGRRPNGSSKVIFAQVGRESIQAIMFGDHNSFNDGSLRRAVAAEHLSAGVVVHGLTPPREEIAMKERLRLARYGVLTPEFSDGQVIPLGLTGQGFSFEHTSYASKVMRVMHYWEPRLDTDAGLTKLKRDFAAIDPQLNSFRWGFDHGDFGIYLPNKAFLHFLRWKR